MAKIGPHSRPGVLALVDGRRAEAQLMKRVRDDLVKHVGGKPSATQKILIDRAAALALRIHLMDQAELKSDFMSEKNAREYLCWTSALSRLLRQLGMQGAKERAPTLQEIMARPASTKAAA